MNIISAPKTLYPIIRYALLVSLISYLPYCFISPWWLLLFILGAMAYRLIFAYYGCLISVPKSIQLVIIVACLLLLKAHYGSIITSNFYIGFLLTFTGLKITEIHNERDLRVLILCNLYLVFSALIVIQELWIIAYLIIAVLINLSLLLRINAPEASLKKIGGTSFKHLLFAIPLSVALFYLFPRIENPLWQVPNQTQGQLGFSDKMTPGSIAQLFKDDSTAFRVSFKNKPYLNEYWRGLILSYYNGVSWDAGEFYSVPFKSLPQLTSMAAADFEVLLEPHNQKWLFYTQSPVSGDPQLSFSNAYGLINPSKVISQRFAYALQVQKPTYSPLDKRSYLRNTQLPIHFNPQLSAWAKENYQRLNRDPEAFIHFIKTYIHQEPFWYTLAPGVVDTKDQMDAFWFTTRKGYCEHYSSAVTVILRSVGIPSRVVVGYQGGVWNPLARFLDVQQNHAHAWLEYWREGSGWQLFDPTAFIAKERIEQVILEHQNERLTQDRYSDKYSFSWLERSKLMLESARFFAERWLLFYNQDTQSNLLHILGLEQWGMGQLLQASIGCVIVFLILLGLFHYWWQRRDVDTLLSEYHLLQRELRRYKVVINPSSTLQQQCHNLIAQAPGLANTIKIFLFHYEKLRLQSAHAQSKENIKKTIKLLRVFRRKIQQYKVS